MKVLLTGVFIAIAALPTGFAAATFALPHLLGGFPAAMVFAGKVTGVMLGLALFVFAGGLVKKPQAAFQSKGCEEDAVQ